MHPFLKDCARGLVLYIKGGEEHPLDFVISGPTKTIAMSTNWWRLEQWALNEGMFVFNGAVIPNGADCWTIAGANPAHLYFSSPDSEEDWAWINNGHADQDLNRAAYNAKLDSFGAYLDEELRPAFKEWRDYINARPVQLAAVTAIAPRKTLCIQVKDPETDRIIDVMAFDEFHDANTANETSWAAGFVPAWWDKDCPPGDLDLLRASFAEMSPSRVYFGETFVAVSNLPLDALARSHL